MQIEIIQAIAGGADPRYSLPDFAFRAGEKVEIDAILAGHWIASGIAKAVKSTVAAAAPASQVAKPVKEGK
jgi:hypothetical protein